MKRDLLRYPQSSEAWWKEQVNTLAGYTPRTTFFSDLSIAECFGKTAIIKTYRDIIKQWGRDIIYITEFVMCLNYKIWQLYELDKETAKLYNDLWYKSRDYVINNFKGDDLSYYYNTID